MQDAEGDRWGECWEYEKKVHVVYPRKRGRYVGIGIGGTRYGIVRGADSWKLVSGLAGGMVVGEIFGERAGGLRRGVHCAIMQEDEVYRRHRCKEKAGSIRREQ